MSPVVGSNPDIDALVDSLTPVELISLLAGDDAWHTAAVERLGIPRMRVTDGPAGARGTSFSGPASMNVPCGTALAATWDVDLVTAIGGLLGREVKAKGASVLLAPTVNLHRTPIGGRNFECMSEDPLLTARTAVAYVRGVQAEGVASCVKHFVGNDTEFERMSIDSRIDERTLREMYLAPFEAAVREAGVLAVMTAYNRINGPFAADSSELVAGVLRGEWGFDGLVMSDWFGLHSTVEGLRAGVDLEMPGPTIHRGQKLLAALDSGEVSIEEVKCSAHAVLTLLHRTAALESGGPALEVSRHDVEDVALVRRAAAASMVLLRNNDHILPVQPGRVGSMAIVGPNAVVGQIMGGGSAWVRVPSPSQPATAIADRAAVHGITTEVAPGCRIHRQLPVLDRRVTGPINAVFFDRPDDLDDPLAMPTTTEVLGLSRHLWMEDPLGRSGRSHSFGVRITANVIPDVSGTWQFGLTAVGDARLLLDGDVLIDTATAPRGGSFFGLGSAEQVVSVELVAGAEHELAVELRRDAAGVSMTGMQIGALGPVSGDLMTEAVDAAARADLSVVVVGTNDDWECEGWDRETLDLPGRQNELVARVAAASRRTVVIVNAGSPVAMPWLDQVDAVLFAWFPGEQMGEALADVLFGAAEPAGRLPVTFPRALEDTPAFEHHPGRAGVANYLEGRLIGYRWYDTVGREPLFPFGFGLGYGQAELIAAEVIDAHNVRVSVRNPGVDATTATVQIYARRLGDRSGDDAFQRLVGFAHSRVGGGEEVTVDIQLDPRSYLSWRADTHGWEHTAGPYELRIGWSSRDIVTRLVVDES